jgi:lipid-binding SYLF domain-containing protein
MKQLLHSWIIASFLLFVSLGLNSCANGPITEVNAAGVDARQLSSDAQRALNELCRNNATAQKLRTTAKGILVFPKVTKGGFMLGGMGGNGVLIRPDGTVRDYYQTAGVSYGIQAGVQQFGYALFLMDDSAFANINRSSGWEFGANPSLVVVDQAMATSLSTTTIHEGTYAFFFHQRGLMGGIGLQGSKITRLNPKMPSPH